MADITKLNPSTDHMVGGPTDSKLGGSVKPGGFARPSGDQNASPQGTPSGDRSAAGQG